MINKILFILLPILIFASCRTGEIKDGATAYQLKQYANAISLLKQEFGEERHTGRKGEIAYYVADSYDQLTNYSKALEWIDLAERNAYGAKAVLKKVELLTKLERYQEAIGSVEELLKGDPQNLRLKRKKFTLEAAIRLKEKSSNYKITGFKANSPYYDYSPVIYEGAFLVFTSDREDATGKERYKWTNHRHSDIYISEKNGKFVRPFDALINTTGNDGTPAFSSDYNKMVYASCISPQLGEDAHCQLYQSNRVEGVWENPTKLPFMEKGFNYGHPTFVENDSVLVFSRRGQTESTGFDLWYSVLDPTGLWTTPYPMPETINTEGNEMFASSDGDTLYFSSDYLPGLGGLDIFKTYLKDGKWTTPEHLPYPINSGADDFGLIVDNDARTRGKVVREGYFTSSRNKDVFDDIFKFSLVQDQPVDSLSDEPSDELDRDYTIYLALKVVEILEENNFGKPLKKGIPNANIDIILDQKVEFEERTTRGGLIIKELTNNQLYQVKVFKNGYYTKTIDVSTKGLNVPEGEQSFTINKEVSLDKIELGEEIVLENIYYDFNKWDIRPDAEPTLQNLIAMLDENPTVDIELASYTDCRGEILFNEDLSQKRANSAVAYMIKNGIDPDRLVAKGYGEAKPAIDCECDICSEEEHQANRRTTFKILAY